MPLIKNPKRHWNPVSLALLGDGVFSVYAITNSMLPPANGDTMQKRLIALCSAEAQVRAGKQAV